MILKLNAEYVAFFQAMCCKGSLQDRAFGQVVDKVYSPDQNMKRLVEKC